MSPLGSVIDLQEHQIALKTPVLNVRYCTGVKSEHQKYT
ncbi:hypothetical protein MITS9509_02751 [Synechococcus sp. MIT S9509]|nr:hypothetical protein MITS9504_02105 [Synechococcus sp. MIT S9504]KZR90462.1 hypothetical protein MITS9509_02751 [Synechococcus sp. MIT S9509]